MHRLRLVPLCLLACLLAACGASDTPEQQIRNAIAEMETAAESRDVGDLMAHVAADYSDGAGHDAEAIRRYVHGYFIANQSIHLLTRVDSLIFPQPDEARATVTVGMVGREADAATAWNLAADLYEFEVVLIRRAETWQVTRAQWRRLGG